jgi:aspartyl protease family protein
MQRIGGIVGVAGLALMLFCVAWAIFLARSYAEGTVAIFAGAAIGVLLFIGRMIKFATEIGAWPFIRNAGGLVALFAFFIGVYTFRHDAGWVADRIMRELDPAGATAEADGTISLVLSDDGHYHTRAMVNGVTINFMIDTGASGIVLAPYDAQRIGFNVGALNFSEETETANGIGRAAIIRLDDLRIEHLAMQDLPARVNAAHMSDSLLGMEFLRRLNGWRVERGVLLLDP